VSVAPNSRAEEPFTSLVLAHAPPAPADARRRVSFINEASMIGDALQASASLDNDAQVVVVDDGSVDDTPGVAGSALLGMSDLVIRQPNRGKGAAVRAARTSFACSGFGRTTFDRAEITSQARLRRLRVFEVPIADYGRTYAEEKKSARDGCRALGVLVTTHMRNLGSGTSRNA
jgi:glycosyltransferase involved in cell wall biosynthesis